jgi:hypothetical protein
MTTHDIEIQDLKTSKTVVGQGYKLSVNATITNYGMNTETFHITLYANTTSIATQTVTLRSISYTIITFTWNTSSFAKGNYTILAYALPVQGETHTADNTFVNGWVAIAIAGDLDGNFEVRLADLVILAKAYGSKPGEPKWNPNADIDNNDIVGLTDLVILAKNYGKADP